MALAQSQPVLWDTIQPEKAPDAVPNPVARERARLHAANLRVLAFLQQRGAQGATNVEICHPSVGGAEGCKRARELRAWGYDIPTPTRTPGSGTTRYVLRGIKAL